MNSELRITIIEGAKAIRVKPLTVRTWIRSGILPAYGDLDGECITCKELVSAWSIAEPAENTNADEESFLSHHVVGERRITAEEVERRILQSRAARREHSQDNQQQSVARSKNRPPNKQAPIPIRIAAEQLNTHEGLIRHLFREKRLRLISHQGKHCVFLDEAEAALAQYRDERKPQMAKPRLNSTSHPKTASKRKRHLSSIDLNVARPIDEVASMLGISRSEIWVYIDRQVIAMFTGHGTPAVRPIDVVHAERDYYHRVQELLTANRPNPPDRTRDAHVRQEIPPKRAESGLRLAGHITQPGKIAPRMWQEIQELESSKGTNDRKNQRLAFLRNMLSQIDPNHYREYLKKRTS